MKRNSKLSLALHALGHMAGAAQPLTSDQIALQNATNPVVVRRVLGLLRQAGIVRSDKGHAGGWRLARDAATISVADVARALGDPVIPQPAPFGPTHCAIERALHGLVDAALAEAEVLVMRRLGAQSIAGLAVGMQAACGEQNGNRTFADENPVA